MKKIDDRPVTTINQMDPTNNVYSYEKMENLLLNNKDNKYIICDDVQTIVEGGGEPIDFDTIMKEGLDLKEGGYFKVPGVGKDQTFQKRNDIRDDIHCFIGPSGGMSKE